MALMSQIVLEIASLFMCKTLYYEGNLGNIDNYQLGQVVSDSPWKHLKSYTLAPKSDKCAILILDDLAGYTRALPYLNKTRLSVSVALITRNSSIYLSFEESMVEFPTVVLHIIKDNIIGGISKHSPFDNYGKAKKRYVTVSHLHHPPYVIRTGKHLAGSDIDIITSLSSRLNFGITHLDGQSFNGMVSHIINGSADMCLAHPRILLNRYQIGLGIIVLTPSSIIFVQRHPVPVNSIYTITSPFTISVWTALLVTIVTICLLLKIFNRWCISSSVNNTLSICLAPVTSESIPSSLLSQLLKPYLVLLCFWILVGSLISKAYESNLLASLVKVDLEKQPEIVQDVVDLKIGLYITTGTLITEILKQSPFPSHHRFYKESLLKHGGFYNSTIMPDEIWAIFFAGKAVVVTVDKMLPMYRHVVRPGKEPLYFSYDGYYTRQSIPLKPEIEKGLQHFLDCGIIEEARARVDWKLQKPWRDLQRSKSSIEPVVLGLNHVLPMLILLSGLLLAISIKFIIHELRPCIKIMQ